MVLWINDVRKYRRPNRDYITKTIIQKRNYRHLELSMYIHAQITIAYNDANIWATKIPWATIFFIAYKYIQIVLGVSLFYFMF